MAKITTTENGQEQTHEVSIKLWMPKESYRSIIRYYVSGECSGEKKTYGYLDITENKWVAEDGVSVDLSIKCLLLALSYTRKVGVLTEERLSEMIKVVKTMKEGRVAA